MSPGRPRYQLSREEIGLLLSYARYPEAVTQEWVGRLRIGVDNEELAEFVEVAGLPRNSVERIVASRVGDEAAVGVSWPQQSLRYRRAIRGVLIVYVLGAVIFSFASDDPLRSILLAITFAVSGLLVYEVIVRLSSRVG